MSIDLLGKLVKLMNAASGVCADEENMINAHDFECNADNLLL